MTFALLNSSNFGEFLIYLIIALVAIVISIVLHELAHGYVALWNGDPTAKYSGRLTLNPLRHFDLTGFLMLLFVGFGFAKPVPINPYNFKHQKRGIFTVSIAGVTVNLLLAFFSMPFMLLCGQGYVINGTMFLLYLSNFFFYMTSLNLVLMFFNILPIYPLDGFHVIESLTHAENRFNKFMLKNGRTILIGLVGVSFIVSMVFNYARIPSWFSYFDILGTYLNYASRWVLNGFSSLWSLVIF